MYVVMHLQIRRQVHMYVCMCTAYNSLISAIATLLAGPNPNAFSAATIALTFPFTGGISKEAIEVLVSTNPDIASFAITS